MSTANQIARGKLRDENESLLEQLTTERTNYQRSLLVMSCLVKRLGKLLPDDHGWRVFVTDEEVEAVDGELQVLRSEAVMGIVITLIPKPKAEEDSSDAVGKDEGERNLDSTETTLQEGVQEQNPVEGT
jgi:hypothetical protein